LTDPRPLLATRKKWLPNDGASEKLESAFVIDFGAARKRLRPQQDTSPALLVLLERAEAYQRQLGSGEAPSLAYLARANGLTRARVTQVMNLLKLHPTILEHIRAMPEMPRNTWVAEAKLPPITALPQAKQLAQASRILPGFGPDTKGRCSRRAS
jgi:hypothetical protein